MSLNPNKAAMEIYRDGQDAIFTKRDSNLFLFGRYLVTETTKMMFIVRTI